MGVGFTYLLREGERRNRGGSIATIYSRGWLSGGRDILSSSSN